MKKLTPKQKELMGWVNRVNQVGTWSHKQNAFYCECGRYKPFNERTVNSLIKKGLVISTEDSEPYKGVFFLRPTNKTI